MSFTVFWEYDTAEKAHLEIAETQSDVMYPLFALEEEIQHDLEVWASFVRAYQKGTEEYGREWETRRQRKLGEGLPNDGTADAEVFRDLGLPDDTPFPCSAAEVRQWAQRWLDILEAMTEEQDQALFWEITARLIPAGGGREARFWVPDGAVVRVKAEVQADLEKVAQQSAYAESYHLSLLCSAGLD